MSPSAVQHLAGRIEILQFGCLPLDQDSVTPLYPVMLVSGPPLVMRVCRGGAREAGDDALAYVGPSIRARGFRSRVSVPAPSRARGLPGPRGSGLQRHSIELLFRTSVG